MHIGASMPTAKVTNISSMSGVMHNGRIFAPSELPTKLNGKGKAKEDVVERGKVVPMTNNEAHVKKPTKEEDSLGKKEISSKEAIEFLRIIQQSKSLE